MLMLLSPGNAKRWVPTALLDAEKRTHRISGYRFKNVLINEIKRLTNVSPDIQAFLFIAIFKSFVIREYHTFAFAWRTRDIIRYFFIKKSTEQEKRP